MGTAISGLLGNGDVDVPDEGTGLTPREKKAIRDTWALAKQNAKVNGVELLIMFFTRHPEDKKRFKDFANLSLDELRENNKMHAHAVAVMYAMTSLIDTLDDPECLVGLLDKTVATHVKRGLTIVQYQNLFNVILEFLCEKLGTKATPAIKEAWKKLFEVMIKVIRPALEKSKP